MRCDVLGERAAIEWMLAIRMQTAADVDSLK
jgi:hypothetical protein